MKEYSIAKNIHIMFVYHDFVRQIKKTQDKGMYDRICIVLTTVIYFVRKHFFYLN